MTGELAGLSSLADFLEMLVRRIRIEGPDAPVREMDPEGGGVQWEGTVLEMIERIALTLRSIERQYLEAYTDTRHLM